MPKCRIYNCNVKYAYFNFHGEKQGIYCTTHKENGMIDVINRRCSYEGCTIRPNYNYENKRLPLYCCHHKLDGMVDIKHKKCKSEGCTIRPSYNYEGEKCHYIVHLINLKI